MRYLMLIVLSLMYLHTEARENKIKETWVQNSSFSEIFPEYENENVVAILMDEWLEFFYNPNGELYSVHTLYRKYRLNSDESIDQFNKISVSLSGVIELVEIKARVIKPDGRIVDFDESNIKEIKDEEKGNSFKIFAIDGIEKGDEMEYYIIRKMSANNFGRSFFQFEYPVQKALFTITSPKNLIYDVKGYNDFPSATHTVIDSERNMFFCEMESIAGLKREKYSYFTPRRARIEYRLDYNLERSRSQRLTWDDAAQRIYEMMYLEVNAKHIDRWIKTLKIPKGTSLAQASYIEEYIKSNIFIQEFHIPEFEDFDYIRTKKVSSERGIVKLYVNLFKRLGIQHQIVLTSERDGVKFDPTFQSWNFLDKYLIYLPEIDSYIDPSIGTYRIGYVDDVLTATNGLFIQLLKLGSFESAIGKIGYIEPTPYHLNYDNMRIVVSVDVENAQASITNTRGFKGLSGGYLGRIYKMRDRNQKEALLKSLMETKAPNPDYSKLEVIGSSNIEFLSDADFLIFSEFTTSAFIEIAGDKILLKVGEAIGPQVEMYYESDRKAHIENSFNRLYYREITVNVPSGYRIVNPEASVINILEKSGLNVLFGFESNYTYDGNVYRIVIDEYYKEIFADISHYEGFRNVINAAADFNKVVLVLEKE